MTIKGTVILVADVKGWAFDNIAVYLVKLLEHKYDVKIIYVSEYKDYEAFLDVLNAIPKIDFIHFFYRIYLRELLKHFTNDPLNPKLKKLLNSAIVTSIPDKMFLKEHDIIANESFFSFVDNYYSVSKELLEIYSNINIYPKPYGFIYDNVLIESEPNFTSKDKLQVTWIGNSAWGSDYFGPDYDSKGFQDIIKPVLSKIQKEFGIDINIADAVSSRHSKEEIKEILQKTDILLIGAKGEGTPLPLIEAMASGCAVISTNVGIVPEILRGDQKQFIVERNVDSFVKAILKLDSNRDLLTKLKKDNYSRYKKIFLNSEDFTKKWSNLIEDTILLSTQPERIKYKNTFLSLELIKNIIDNKIKSSFINNILRFLSQFTYSRNLIIHLYISLRGIVRFAYKIKEAFNRILVLITRTIKKIFIKEEAVFANIYKTDFWTNGSGPGSTKENTVEYRKILQQYFDNPKYQTYADLGCGDWQIMSLIKIPKDKIYKGYDIVKTVIDSNKERFTKENVHFYHSINIDNVEPADLLIVKDVLMHWPNQRVEYFTRNILPKFKYALITEGYNTETINTNINFGEWRPVDLTSAPFDVKKVKQIGEYEVSGVIKKIYFYTNPNIK